MENQKSARKLSINPWIIITAIITALMTAGVIIGVLAISGAFNDSSTPDDQTGNTENISCPIGKHKVCGMLADGKKACSCHSRPDVVLKPIIYLYPETETELTIKLGAPERLTVSYPKYLDGWNVIAYPGGDLIDKTTGEKLYSLYWEGKRNGASPDKSTGFLVKAEDAASFLSEKLELLGLNYKEKEEFIVYWLPKLESHKYNYIYFATAAEIEADMPLELSVKPDTIIRVRMLFEGLDEYQEVTEQQLAPAPTRTGFTVVEWGGTDLTEQ